MKEMEKQSGFSLSYPRSRLDIVEKKDAPKFILSVAFDCMGLLKEDAQLLQNLGVAERGRLVASQAFANLIEKDWPPTRDKFLKIVRDSKTEAGFCPYCEGAEEKYKKSKLDRLQTKKH